MSILYAAYGSNLHPLRLAARLPAAELLGHARIAGRDMKFHKRGADGSGKGSIVEADADIYVAVYRLGPDDRPVLDTIEGRGYEHAGIDVPGYGQCYTYVATASHVDDTLLPYDWYRELVLAGCRRHGFPDAYIERLAATGSRPDSDERRGAQHWALVKRLLTDS